MIRNALLAGLALLLGACSGNSTSTSCGKDGDCDDGVYCNGTETCDTKTHKCVTGSAPSCDDSVKCTADICDEASKSCLHLADNSQCTAGNTCDVKGDCVPSCDGAECASACSSAGFVSGTCAGAAFCQCGPSPSPAALSGNAFLFGHTAGDAAHNHAGISVGLAGTSLTTSTAADGSYTLANVPVGVYTVTFSKDKYFPASLPNSSAGNGMTTSIPPVTLNHGRFAGDMRSRVTTSNGVPLNLFTAPDVRLSADNSHSLAEVQGAIIQGVTTLGVRQLFAFPADASAAPIDLLDFNFALSISAPAGGTVFQISNDHLVFTQSNNDPSDGVWSRPLDASASALRLAAPPLPSPAATTTPWLGVVGVIGTVGQFTIVESRDDKFAPARFSWNAFHTDGSGSPINLWTGSATSFDEPVYFYNDDSLVVFATADNTPNVTLHAFDLAAATDHPMATTFTDVASEDAVTPDHKWAMGWVHETGNPFCLLVALDTSGYFYTSSSQCTPTSNVTAVSDSSGFAFTDISNSYSFFLAAKSLAQNPIQVVPSSGRIAPKLAGKMVYYTDSNPSQSLAIANLPTVADGSVTAHTLDPSPAPAALFSEVSPDGGSAHLVWAEANGQLRGVSVTFPLTSGSISAVSFGSPLTPDCMSMFSTGTNTAAFGGDFYYECPENWSLTALPIPFDGTVTPVETSGVASKLLPLVSSQRMAYRKSDGSYWAANGSATVKLSMFADNLVRFINIDPWVIFFDSTQISRVSNVSGAVIDEPLTACNLIAPANLPTAQPAKLTSSILTPTAVCGVNDFNPYSLPLTNLP